MLREQCAEGDGAYDAGCGPPLFLGCSLWSGELSTQRQRVLELQQQLSKLELALQETEAERDRHARERDEHKEESTRQAEAQRSLHLAHEKKLSGGW